MERQLLINGHILIIVTLLAISLILLIVALQWGEWGRS